jgi:hypothetical protein
VTRTLTHELRYDGATPEQVYAMLADPTFREDVCTYQRVLRHDVSITAQGDGMTVAVDQVQQANGIPGFAKKFVGDEIQIVQRETWGSPTEADLEVSIPGRPGDVKGLITLSGDADGTTEVVSIEIRVSIPLVGGKIEGLIADLFTKALKAENKVGRDRLAVG